MEEGRARHALLLRVRARTMNDPRVYAAEDWPHGLRCMDCEALFADGQPIAERLTALTEYADEPAFVVDVICVGCSVAGAVTA
jgi:hypothetical protein